MLKITFLEKKKSFYTCGEGDAGWGGEVGAPKAMQGRRVVGVEHKALQGVVHGVARG